MTVMDDRYSIDTPEHITFDYDVAGIGSRFLAALIDGVILIAMSVAINSASTYFVVAQDLASTFDSLAIGALGLLNFTVFWGYFIFLELAWNGQSLGKRIVGLRVVREGGRPITLGASAIRNLVRIADFLPFFYGLGVIVMFIDRRSRRLGDLAAGTLVVKDRQTVTLASLTASTPPPFQSTTPALQLSLPNLYLLNSTDYDLAQEFLRRRNDFRPEVRSRLGQQLADRLRIRLELDDEIRSDESLIERIVIEYPSLRRSNDMGIQG